MGTRGLFGFKLNEEKYLQFTPHDAQPFSLGDFWLRVVKMDYNLNTMEKSLLKIRSVTIEEGDGEEELVKKISELKAVGDARDYIKYYDELLVEREENIFDKIYDGEATVFLNHKEFENNSLFCSWVYYYDFDKEKFIAIRNYDSTVLELDIKNESIEYCQELLKKL